MTVAMHGALHKDHLQIDELHLGAFGGNAQLVGVARWSPEESWALEGSVKRFNPATLRPGFNGALDFDMKASGAPFGGDGKLDFAYSNLSGKLRSNSASGSGRIILQGEDWTFEGLRFRAGQHQPRD
jgi:autotransporter translocation and assembly factor TamB